jgi:hypothetical protein
MEFDSSDINDIAYDAQKKELTVVFANNWKYTYFDVDLLTVSGMAHASSIGTYFNQMVKKRKFRYERVA